MATKVHDTIQLNWFNRTCSDREPARLNAFIVNAFIVNTFIVNTFNMNSFNLNPFN